MEDCGAPVDAALALFFVLLSAHHHPIEADFKMGRTMALYILRIILGRGSPFLPKVFLLTQKAVLPSLMLMLFVFKLC